MRRVARILILGGGQRALRLVEELRGEGHAARVVTRSAARRTQIEAAGGECFLGDPDRLVTLRAALEHVAIACWLFATASGEPERVRALHGSRLRRFLTSLVDTTVRGLLYETCGIGPWEQLVASGEQAALDAARRHSIPVRILRADPRDPEEWVAQARGAVRELLGMAGGLSSWEAVGPDELLEDGGPD
jgi:hypothetical protein